MIITVASYKGGVGKTTTAVHIAAYLHGLGKTLLLDADQTRNATNWSTRGTGLPFKVAPAEHAAKLASTHKHVVIDTGQRPTGEDLRSASEGCDLLIVPAVPSPLDTDGLAQTIQALQSIKASNYRVLLTRVPPEAAKDAVELRGFLANMGAPVFTGEIPRLKAYERAAGQGTTAELVDDRMAARAWGCYVGIGEEITL